MSAIAIICAFVCVVCTIFNAIVIKKLGKVFNSFFEMQDQIKSISSFSTLSNMGINLK